MRLQSRPNAFQTNLCDAPCKEPLSCCCTGLFPCCLAPQWRLAVLEQYGRGIDDYVCCQGYVPKVCCCDFPEMGRGDSCCMWLEGCLCDTLSLSFTRIYLMDAKQLHPDPVDYQIIRFSNCMQVLACICNFAAIFDKNLRELAHIIDWVAEIVERVVAGCLGGQIMAELRHSKRLLSGGDGGLGANLVTANPVHVDGGGPVGGEGLADGEYEPPKGKKTHSPTLEAAAVIVAEPRAEVVDRD